MPAGSVVDGGVARRHFVAGLALLGLVQRSLFIGDVRQNENLTPICQRNPRITLAAVIFTLLGVICLCRKLGQSSSRSPCGIAL
jgi:hypothetical protein